LGGSTAAVRGARQGTITHDRSSIAAHVTDERISTDERSPRMCASGDIA
jgi:hypothetical protein